MMPANLSLRLALSVLLAALLGGCPRPSSERLVITGSSTVAPILQKAAEVLERRHLDLIIDVQTGGSGRGVHDALRGSNDLGAVSRSLTPEEARELQAYTIALDGVSVIVHRDNPVELSSEQLRGIYTGSIGSWPSVGGVGANIIVVNKAEGRATLTVFLAHLGLSISQLQPDVVVGDNAQAIRSVAVQPGAIAYVSIGEALHAIEQGAPIRLLSLDGVHPSLASVQDGTYPMTRALTLVSRQPAQGWALALIELLASPEGHALIAELGYIPRS